MKLQTYVSPTYWAPSYSRCIQFQQECLKLISDRFPNSPRVDCLTGIRMEATERPEIALRYYEELLEADSSNSVSNS